MEQLRTTTPAGSLRPKYLFILAVWSVLIGASLAWNIRHETDETLSKAFSIAQSHIDKDIALAKWVASHGGVYVAPTAATPPNPYLDIPNRDVVTTDGKALTLLNPDYSLRLLHESFDRDSPVKSHITSLKPINPNSVADPWEKDALERFEKGVKTVSEVYASGGKRHLRLMVPFFVEPDCLKCHGEQGYRPGQVRGGISADVSMQMFQAEEREQILNQIGSHGLIWLLGLLGTGGFYRRERNLDAARKIAQDQVFEREALFRNYFELGRVGMCVTSLEHKWLRVNRCLCDMLGYSEDELTRMTWSALTHPDDLNLDLAQFKRLLEGTIESYDLDKRFIHKDGSIVYTHLTATCQLKIDGTVDYVISSLDDITRRKQWEERVHRFAFYDSLTELPNRRLLEDRLNLTMAASRRSARYCALMFLDLDNFKPLNDTHGHGVGDLLLIEVARRLTDCVREMDTVARIGGDEFVVLLGELDVDKDAATEKSRVVAEKIRVSLSARYLLNVPRHKGLVDVVVEHHCSASIGVVVFVKDEVSQSDILRWADATMYQAKNDGRNSILFYEEKA